MLNVEIKNIEGFPCALEVFTINGIEAADVDFGIVDGYNNGKGGCYSCFWKSYSDLKGDRLNKIMKKYNITEEEVNEVCAKLEDALTFGSCGWCE